MAVVGGGVGADVDGGGTKPHAAVIGMTPPYVPLHAQLGTNGVIAASHVHGLPAFAALLHWF